ncbi:MAG TPA: endolytic transglycosylase MltG [Candidatus Bipolaricaulota bacterium]|nr:endolytic transglycosylase MltG [Candidatus Bipolaricaulota bacterium]
MKKLFFLILILLLGLAAFGFLKFENLKENLNISENIPFKVESGMSAKDIVEKLRVNDIVKDESALLWYIKFKGLSSNFVAGTYWLKPEYNSFDLIDALSGQGDKFGRVTIIEGWDQMQIAAELTEQDIVSGLEFLDEVQNGFWRAESRWTFWDGKPMEADLEGYLYPDTYFFDPQAGSAGVIEKMLENLDQKLTPELRTEIKRQKKTIFEVLTLASIVEKEMHGYENRRIVADVFLKRLNIGMPLQSDATINYITKKGTTRPSFADLEIQHPYNTYENKGLPPGPICNPSIEAIKAVVYPEPNDYYYFLNTEDGEIIYSKTFEEHVANKQKYLQ